MKACYKFAAASAALLLLAFGLLYSTRSVSAAAEGKITGTIKLDGTAPHQKPIDMSKEPFCAKEHASSPITTETVIPTSTPRACRPPQPARCLRRPQNGTKRVVNTFRM